MQQLTAVAPCPCCAGACIVETPGGLDACPICAAAAERAYRLAGGRWHETGTRPRAGTDQKLDLFRILPERVAP